MGRWRRHRARCGITCAISRRCPSWTSCSRRCSGSCGTAALRLARRRPLVEHGIVAGVVGVAALSCLYAMASVFFFSIFGGFLTYPLLALVGDVHMLRSSVAAQVSRGTVLALVGVPLGYLVLVVTTLRLVPANRAASWRLPATAATMLLIWIAGGEAWYAREWTTRRDRQVAANPQWVFVSSWWQAIAGEGAVRMAGSYSESDLADFEPLRRTLAAAVPRLSAARRPPNVVLIVLESVAARWASLNRGAYDSTPNLLAESARGLVFDNFYAHIGRSSNSLGAILLSRFPEARLQRSDRGIPAAARNLDRVGVPRPRLSDRLPHAERSGLGRLAHLSRSPRLRPGRGSPSAAVRHDAVVVGHGGPLPGRRHDRVDREGSVAAVLRDGVDRNRRIIPTSRRRECRCIEFARDPIPDAYDLEPLPQCPARDRSASRAVVRDDPPGPARPGHAGCDHRRSRPGVRRPARQLHARADRLRRGRAACRCCCGIRGFTNWRRDPP